MPARLSVCACRGCLSRDAPACFVRHMAHFCCLLSAFCQLISPAVPAGRPPHTPSPCAPPTHLRAAGDDEEIERFWKELGLNEKGKVLVKGILS